MPRNTRSEGTDAEYAFSSQLCEEGITHGVPGVDRLTAGSAHRNLAEPQRAANGQVAKRN